MQISTAPHTINHTLTHSHTMKHIEDALTCADALADFVSAGLADQPDNQALSKDLARDLKKLIVNALNEIANPSADSLKRQSQIQQAVSTSNVGRKPTGVTPIFRKRKKGTFDHPHFKNGENHSHCVMVKDYTTGKAKASGRTWHKTTFIPCHPDGSLVAKGADGVPVVFVAWDALSTQDPAIDDANQQFHQAVKGEVLKLQFKVKHADKAGDTKFNPKHHEITVKVAGTHITAQSVADSKQ